MSHIKYEPFCDEKEAKGSFQELPFYKYLRDAKSFWLVCKKL